MNKISNCVLLIATVTMFFRCTTPDKPFILVSKDASTLEQLAAKEIRRYIYLRTNMLLPIENDKNPAGSCIELQINDVLGDQEFTLKTEINDDQHHLLISGGTAQAVLYGAYEFAEQLGIRFYLHGDVIPDEKIAFSLPNLDISKKPVFDKRGIQPFHDFPEGPDWWSEQDYKTVIAQLAKMKMNFIGFHTYSERTDFDGEGPKAEPLVWIGKEEDINEKGVVNAAYPVLHFHTNDSTWGYMAMPTSDFSLGASQIFETDNYGADYMKNVSSWPHSDDENKLLFQEVGNLFGNVFGYAKVLGFTTCVGTETPVIIPEKMKARYEIESASDDEIKEIYKGIFSRISQTYPLDYYWLWTPESWTWSEVTDDVVAKTQKDIQLARQVLGELGNPFALATCGWVLGPPKDRTQFDRILTKDIAFSCINRALGYAPIDPGFQDISGRSKWAIPWMEDDPDMITSQLWVGRLRKDALDAYRYGCDGLFGIHWRTRILGPNVSALAKAAWECDKWTDSDPVNRDLGTSDFYEDWTFTQFGINNPDLVQLFVDIDSKGTLQSEGQKGDAPLNATNWEQGPGGLWIKGASEERISRYDFIPKMESLGSAIKGAGNQERFDYWMNSFKFNRATVETALAYKELDSLVKLVEQKPAEDQKQFVQKEVLPKRIELAEKWTQMTNLLLAKLSDNGELGNLANLEMHSKNKLGLLDGLDSKIETLFGEALPEAAHLSKAFQGKEKVMVFTNPSALQKNDNFHIRIRVLSNAEKIQGKLMWRKLGETPYKEIPLTHMARNVFEVNVPVSTFNDDFEYYVEVKAGENPLIYPATARDINCTVVVF